MDLLVFEFFQSIRNWEKFTILMTFQLGRVTKVERFRKLLTNHLLGL